MNETEEAEREQIADAAYMKGYAYGLARNADEIETLTRERDEAASRSALKWVEVEGEMHDAAEREHWLDTRILQLVAVLSDARGCCWHCQNFTGEDKIQGGRGDDVHEEWCQIGHVLTSLNPPPHPQEQQG